MAHRQVNKRKREPGESYNEYYGSTKHLGESHRRFAEQFVVSFDIDDAAKKTSTIASIMSAKLQNPAHPLSLYINDLLDRRRVANEYFTIDSLYHEVLGILRNPETRSADRIQAAKILLGIQTEPDDAREKFERVLQALSQSNAGKVVENVRDRDTTENPDRARSHDGETGTSL